MNNALRDILINAKQESFRMQHYYLGVEHLFIGLLEIQGGLTASLIEAQGFTPDYLIDAIRRQTGKGTRQRMWAGIRHTPRYDVVMSVANDIAIDSGKSNDDIAERDLLIAVLEENDSVPIRVMKKLGLDISSLSEGAQMNVHEKSYPDPQPHIRVSFSPDYPPQEMINNDQLLILRRMFHSYSQIRIERKLTGGYSSALVLLVTPFHADDSADASIVVKIDTADVILDEAQRYDQHVKTSLPPLTARLEEKPTSAEPSEYAGLKYTFVSAADRNEQNLKIVARDLLDGGVLGEWLRRELYPTFGRTWWGQRKPYRFQVWMEYDWILPPLLTLEFMADDDSIAPKHILRDPIRRHKISEIEYGDVIAIENFTVQRVDHEKDMLRLTIGKGSEAAKRAYKIDVKGVNLAQTAYYRGENLERLVGRVWKNREELLQHAAGALFPNFDTRADVIAGIPEVDPLPNPLLAYPSLLELHVNGSVSKIHGDLHLGNILVGPHNSAFLIDFAQTRDGHTLFDWACLEVSLINDLLMPAVGEGWDAARLAARCIYALNHGLDLELGDPTINTSVKVVFPSLKAVREIIRECLAKTENWAEYHVALTLCCLRAVTWDTMSIAGRRAMLLIAGLSLHELHARPSRSTSGDRTPSYFDDADVTDVTE